MTDQFVIALTVKAVWVMIQLAAPPLLAAVTGGLVISIIQAATQVNEQTLSFIPKILMMTAAMVFCGPWMLHTILGFTSNLFTEIPSYIRGF